MNAGKEMPRAPRLVYVVTVDLSTKLFEGQAAFLAESGFEVHAVCSPGARLDGMRQKGVTTWPISMKREIALCSDAVSLFRLWMLFRRIRPDIVVAGTPKAGLLGTVAARIAAVPIVEYKLHGLRFETATGIRRAILMSTEWIACHAADTVRCVSKSLMKRVIAMHLASGDICHVIANGTSDGIDADRFDRASKADPQGKRIRRELAMPPDAPVIGFVGRMTRDKGIVELYQAFRQLRGRHPELRLLLLGDFEDGDPIPSVLRAEIETDASVIRPGFVEDAERFYPAMDLLALPTYREGFPVALLEAQAAGIAVVTTNATGAVDAVVDGVTGLLIRPRDVETLTQALKRLLEDPGLRAKMGNDGRAWVAAKFRREDVWQEILAHYRSLLKINANRDGTAVHKRTELRIGRTRVFDAQEHH